MLKPEFIFNSENYFLQDWSGRFSDKELEDLGRKVCDAKEVDERSRQDWMDEIKTWLALAQQVIEEKNFPWPRAANIKYPMLTAAALQFHARAHQELLKDERIVKGKIIGRDFNGEKAGRAMRVGNFMSMQMLYKMESWQDDMDRLLYVLPLVGTVFKKTYWGVDNRPESMLIMPDELVVNYYATDWRRARKTHILHKGHNELVELQRLGYYRDVTLPIPEAPTTDEFTTNVEEDSQPVNLPEDVPHTLYEQHCWFDLDEDGYQEPYIVTVEADTQTVLRILPRYSLDRIELDPVEDKVIRIEPIEYLTNFKFFPAIDSSIYGVGFGKLLGPLNKATNTLINQLLDSGTLATQPIGFLGRGIRLARGGKQSFAPGEWKVSQAPGIDLKSNVVPLPIKEPSQVLFNLLGMLLQAGEKVSSVAEVMQGRNPGQNQPFATTQTVLEQGMQVFLGIYKRLYRALTREYRLLFMLNGMFLSDSDYNALLDEAETYSAQVDFDQSGLDIVPEADPNLANGLLKQFRAQSLVQAQQSGMPLNKEYVQRTFLEAIEEPNVEEAMQIEPPPPTEQELEQKRWEKDHALAWAKLQLDAVTKQYESMKDLAQAMALFAKANTEGKQSEMKQAETAMKVLAARQEHALKQEQQVMQMIADRQRHEIGMERDELAIEKARESNAAQKTDSNK